MSFINRLWYKDPNLFTYAVELPLLSLSWIFGMAVSLRRLLYTLGVFKSSAPGVPVVVVGGITVGGSGKTPLCIAVLKELKRQGFRPALLSRGYKGHASAYPLFVEEDTDASCCGDEPLLIKLALGKDALVAVDPRRTRGAFALAQKGADIIVCDDGLQHYALERDVEIVVVDSVRLLGNRKLLPAGPLREQPSRLKTVDAVVCNGGGVLHTGNYGMKLKPGLPQALGSSGTRLQPPEAVCAMAGIGNPERFYATLKASGFKIAECLKVPDHGRVEEKVLQAAASRYPVVMTAKDAVKYHGCTVPNLFVLEVEAQLSSFFYATLMTCIRNSTVRVKSRRLAAGNNGPARKKTK